MNYNGHPFNVLLCMAFVSFRYVEWICRAEDLVLAEDRTTEDDRKLIMEAMKKLSKTNKNDSVETNSLDENEGKYQV